MGEVEGNQTSYEATMQMEANQQKEYVVGNSLSLYELQSVQIFYALTNSPRAFHEFQFILGNYVSGYL